MGLIYERTESRRLWGDSIQYARRKMAYFEGLGGPGRIRMDIREKMKKDWDRRAKVDPLYWVAATPEADEKSYLDSAKHDARAFLDGLGTLAGPDSRVLDVGCGIGRMTAPLAEHFSHVVGVDVSPAMIDRAQEMHKEVKNLEFAVNSGADLQQFDEGEFDLVMAYSVLPHLPLEVVAAYFGEINRVLREGGIFRYQFWVGPKVLQAANDTLSIRVYSQAMFEQLHINHGFEILSTEEIDYLDPVLQLKPIWVNARRTGPVSNNIEFEAFCSDQVSDSEVDLEYNLLLYLATKHVERGEHDQAQAVLESATQLDPTSPTGYLQWAVSAVECGDLKGALTLFEMVVTVDPKLAEGWYFKGQIEEALEKKSDARRSLETAGNLTEDEALLARIEEIWARLGGRD